MLITYMKKFSRTIAAIVVFSCWMGCSQKLDLYPETNLTDAAFWKTPADLVAACNTMYNGLPGLAYGYQDNYSDIAYGAAANNISDGSRLASADIAEWTDAFTMIRRSNTILEKSVNVTGDSATLAKAIGEAYFFRAWAYFELVKRFGDVPLILRTFDIDDTLITAHRTPRATVIASIYSDLDKAAANCPATEKQAVAEYGRITSGAASAFKSRVALFEGTREKFFNYGNANADLTIALQAAQKVMDNTNYGLFKYSKADSSYFYLFQLPADGKANKENIMVRIYGVDKTNSLTYTNISRDLEQAYMTPTRAMLDLYLYKDGLPIGKSPLQQPQTNTLSEFQNRDPRAGMTVFNKNLFYVTAAYKPNYDYTKTGYKVAKWFNAVSFNDKMSYTDFALIRYAEVLLNYAEAKYELNESISDDDLNNTINKIRNRSGLNPLAPLSNAFVSTNGLNMREEIRRERTVELAFEGFRYWDLLRWKKAETELPKVVLGTKYFPTEASVSNPSLDANGYVITQAASKRAFRTDRDYLWPLPTKEFGLNPNLDPNPNW